MHLISILLISIFLTLPSLVSAEENEKKDSGPMKSSTFNGLKFRGIGPGIASGRIIDFAVHPCNNDIIYAAIASGGVWKTTNHGTTWIPIFDSQGSYSIGCVTIDPNNHHTVWVGSGENNSQRSVSHGDGIYRSDDGGKTWRNMGLKKSEHIGKIIVRPGNSNEVWVAAQGPLWNAGGDRGLYKTTDGGKTWDKSLYISENTGVSDLVMDPRDPDVLYASSYQRRRHVWTLINGGPEAAIYKTTDNGKTWNKLSGGLPGGELGRIGLGISPVNPDYIYALIEAVGNKGGFFRSTDRGASWKEMYDMKSSSAQYYQEVFCDPVDVDKVYLVDTYSKYTEDGGKTWKNMGLKERHVDDHALWINPKNTLHWIIGGDGGIYETHDHGKTWKFYENLPVTQFYRIGIDNTEPFYYVYGGTQDNATIGGPVRTVNAHGLMNQDFYFTKGGDGFQTRVDPENPDIVYSQAQYGSLVRFDRKSGQRTDIQPMPDKDGELRWNWDSPLIISPHSNTRLYFAANVLFRSDDRGDSWEQISPDLTKQIDRNQLEIMGKVWGPETVAKNASTSLYGNIVALTESPLKENLIYAGTDDGLIQVSEDAKTWKKIDKFPGIPELSYVSDLMASKHDANTIYACFDNHKMGDFKPYILKSTDKGTSWKSISSNLPDNGMAWTILEDHVDKNLLFVGTEFGIFFSNDGGKKWIQLKSGIPTIAVRDAEIQQRENDLALATFGRGFYILDNYAPLREVNDEMLNKKAHLFAVKDALLYVPNTAPGRRNLGETFFRAENPFGTDFTYYLKETPKSSKKIRQEKAKKLEKEGKTPPYPTFDELRKEDLEESPYLIFTVKNSDGVPVRKLYAPAAAGIHRINWDLDYPEISPVDKNMKVNKRSGYPVLPGQYSVTMEMFDNGKIEMLAGPVKFNCKLLKNETLPPKDRKQLEKFQQDIANMLNTAYGADKYMKALNNRIDFIKKSVKLSAKADNNMLTKIRDIELKLADLNIILHGNSSISSRNANQPPNLMDRLNQTAWYMWSNSSAPTKTNIDSYNIMVEQMQKLISGLKEVSEKDLAPIEKQLDAINAPLTPGRLPVLKK